MKLINLSEEDKRNLFKDFIAKFAKELEEVEFNVNETKISFTADLSSVAKEKIKIVYTPSAYLRMMNLVSEYKTEVGWYGLVERINEKTFRVYDVKICKQYVDGAKVDTEDEDVLEFFNSLTDEEAEHMHFQAHSHVSMSTGASGTDLQNQTDVVKNMGKSGFYIFQIWNKNLDINSYVYDLDNNVFYDRKDVELEIEDEKYGTISQFVDSTEEFVLEKKYTPYVYTKGKVKGKGKHAKDTYEKPAYPTMYPYYNGYYGNYDY